MTKIQNTPLRYAIYLRCSTDDQASGDYSTIDAQRELLLKFVTEKGGLLAGIYSDEGVSGTLLKRSGMDDLLASARSKGVDRVAATYMSRIGRGDAYTIIENDLKRLGVRVELTQENYGNDPWIIHHATPGRLGGVSLFDICWLVDRMMNRLIPSRKNGFLPPM